METTLHTIVTEKYTQFYDEDLVKEILTVGKMRTLAEGEILIDVDERITQIPLMVKGSVKILREDDEGKEMFLYYIEAGSTCAASLTCCMNSQKSNILAIVEEETTFISIPVKYMDEWMSKYKSWRDFILRNYAYRYEELLEVVGQLAFKKMDERILKYLQEKLSYRAMQFLHLQ